MKPTVDAGDVGIELAMLESTGSTSKGGRILSITGAEHVNERILAIAEAAALAGVILNR